MKKDYTRLWLSFILSSVLCLLVTGTTAFGAGAKLVVTADDINVYSGPSVHYRPLLTVSRGASFPASVRRVIGNNSAEFYKILVTFRGGERRIGFVSTSDPVHIEGADVDLDVDSYSSLALAKSAVQFSFGALKNSLFEVAVGYLVYPAPDFYLKAFGGQVIDPTTGNFLLGFEVGLDHLIRGNLSVYGSANTGLLFPVQGNAIFAGSTSGSQFMQGGFGLRYSAGEYAAVSTGILQSAFFNNQNSLLSTGFLITLEVGL